MNFRRGAVAALGGALMTAVGGGGAFAAPPPTAEPPKKEAPRREEAAPGAEAVTLPRPAVPIQPAYPAGAVGEAVVQLEVVVGVDGMAQGVRVVSGAPPFSIAAMSAVASAQFEPARKGKQAVAARFLLEVRFKPPAPAAPVAPTAGAGSAPAAPAAPVAPTAGAGSAPAAPATPVAPTAGAGSAPAAPAAPVAPTAGAGSAPAAPAAPVAPTAAGSAPAVPVAPVAPTSVGAPPMGGSTLPGGQRSAGETRAAGAPSAGPNLSLAPANGPGAAGVGAAPIDVTVEGAHGPAPAPEPAGVHFSAKAVSRVPGAFGDAFRAVEILPGVVPFLSGLPYFYVRGATPTGTGYFLDGVPVPLLFHVGAGPSVIAPAIISSVDFYPGGYPASFGRQIGGVLAADTVTPPARFSAEASLRVLDAGAYATAPLPGERGSAFAAGRFSFTQAVLPLVTKEVNLGYWDYQAGANYRFSEADRLRLLAFGADDFLVQNDGGIERTLYKGQFHRVDLAYEHGPSAQADRGLSGALFFGEEGAEEVAWAGRARVRVAGTVGTDRTSLGGQGDLIGTLGQMRSVADVPLRREVGVRAGADLLVEDRRFEQAPLSERPEDDDGSFAKTFASRTVTTIGAFADLRLSPAPFVQIVGGVRADFFSDPVRGAVGVDPRASARVALFPWLSSVTTFGLAHQRPSFVVPVPGVTPASGKLVLQEAVQASQGLEFRLPARIELQATGYLHEYTNLTDFLATCGPGQTDCNFAARAKGRSYGLELLLRRALTERLGGQIAYTLSRSERTALGETFAADTDRTHVVHVVLGYEFLPGWHAGARFTGYSGRPYSLVAHDSFLDPTAETLVGKRNVARTPGFFRIDVRLSRTWRIGRTGYVTAVLEGLNVTLSKETIDIDCRTSVPGAETCGPQEFGPISIPSLGLSGGF